MNVTEKKAQTQPKANVAKGFIDKEGDWLIIDHFIIDLTYPIVSDCKDRDELGLHYLCPMNVECG